jgi:hypothetical protein
VKIIFYERKVSNSPFSEGGMGVTRSLDFKERVTPEIN